MTNDDPRRVKIAEAMGAHAASPSLTKVVEIPELHAHPTHYIESAEEPDGPWLVESFYGEVVRSIALSHNALPAAVELIEELTEENATVRRAWGLAEDSNAEQAKEIERLRREAKQMEGRIERSNLVLSPNGQMLMPKRGDWSITSDLIARAEAAEAEVERLRKYIKATAPSKSEAKRVIGMCGGGR